MKRRQTVDQKASMLQTSVQYRTAQYRATVWVLFAALLLGGAGWLTVCIVGPTNAATVYVGNIEYMLALEALESRPGTTKAQLKQYVAAGQKRNAWVAYIGQHPDLAPDIMARAPQSHTPTWLLFGQCTIKSTCHLMGPWLYWWLHLPSTAQQRMWLEWCVGALLLALLPAFVGVQDVRGWRAWERRQVEEREHTRRLMARQGMK